MILAPNLNGKPDLPLIAQTLCLPRLLARFREKREYDRCEHSDYRDDDE